MKFAKILIALTLCLCMLTPCVYASTAVYNSATDTVTVSGVVDKLSENLVGNEIADNIGTLVAGKWSVSSKGESTTLTQDKETGVITLASRPYYYTRLVQIIDENVKHHGKGKYKISGSVKLGTKLDAVKIESYVSVAAKKSDGTQESKYCKLIEKTANDNLDVTAWQDFSCEVNIAEEDLIGDYKMKIQFGTNKGYTPDMYFKDLKFEYIYDIPEKLGLAVSDSSANLIYADEIEPDENGAYKTSFQLKDQNTATGCTAKLYNPATGNIENINITNGTNLGTVNMVKGNGKVTVTFDVFDYINVRNRNNFVIYAANYKDNMLAGVKVVPFTVDKTALITQEISVNSDADSTSLFLFDEIDGTYYPIAKASNVTY